LAAVAPHQHAVPLEPGLAGVEPASHRRVDAVATHQDVALGGEPLGLGTFPEAGLDAPFRLRERRERMARVHRLAAEPVEHCLVEHALQPAAVDGELRHLVAGVNPARLAPDLLAEAIGVDQLAGADRHLVEPRQQAELGQLGDGVGEHVDADAQLAEAPGGLVDLAADAARLEHQGQRQPADAASDYDHFHRPDIPVARSSRLALRACFSLARARLQGNRSAEERGGSVGEPRALWLPPRLPLRSRRGRMRPSQRRARDGETR
jgi:hypothetical protein